jgi:hypothetical protein
MSIAAEKWLYWGWLQKQKRDRQEIVEEAGEVLIEEQLHLNEIASYYISQINILDRKWKVKNNIINS